MFLQERYIWVAIPELQLCLYVSLGNVEGVVLLKVSIVLQFELLLFIDFAYNLVFLSNVPCHVSHKLTSLTFWGYIATLVTSTQYTFSVSLLQ